MGNITWFVCVLPTLFPQNNLKKFLPLKDVSAEGFIFPHACSTMGERIYLEQDREVNSLCSKMINFHRKKAVISEPV